MRHEKKNDRGIAELTDSKSQKIRYGAPDGPRKRKENYDGSEPLEYPGHEAVAQFLASPKALQQFESLAALAAHFGVARQTVDKWKRDIDVLRRAEWLTMPNKLAAKLHIRRAWEPIVEKVIERAQNGDMQAIKFCEALAWSEDRPVLDASVTSTFALAGAIASTRDDQRAPEWFVRQQQQLRRTESMTETSDPPTDTSE